MTLTDVQDAKQALEADGKRPSANGILAFLKENGQRGSKKTVLRYLHELQAGPPGPQTPTHPVPSRDTAVLLAGSNSVPGVGRGIQLLDQARQDLQETLALSSELCYATRPLS
jgi:plasmid replication DNA-binding protein KfrA